MKDIIMLVAGVYLVGGSLILNTENIRSALLFKVIPFFLGLGCILSFFGVV